VRSAKSAVIGKHPLSDFVSARQPIKLAEIEAEILKVVRDQLKANNYGMDVAFLGFMKVGLPESVTQSVFDRMKADRNVLSTNLVAQGEAEARKIRSAAEREAATTLAKAEAEATRIRSEGEAVAAEMLPVFQQEPELAAFLLRLQALEDTLTERTTLIFDQNNPPFDLLGAGITNAVRAKR
jgi:membrane protease subunit HflC